jgi:Uncharacterized protein conserved in bacteria
MCNRRRLKMTKEYFKELASYNAWANAQVCNWILQLSNEQWGQQVTSSFNSIEATVLHVVSAENIWLQRFQELEHTEWLQSSFSGTKEELVDIWRNVFRDIKTFLETFEESKLHAPLHFKTLNGTPDAKPYYQVFAHMFNHSTYHRGQLVTMLRQVGFTEVASTDLLNFYRQS